MLASSVTKGKFSVVKTCTVRGSIPVIRNELNTRSFQSNQLDFMRKIYTTFLLLTKCKMMPLWWDEYNFAFITASFS